MQNIQEKAKDDQDFLYNYGSVRSNVPTKAYRDGWDRIFGADRNKHSIADNSVESQKHGGNKQ